MYKDINRLPGIEGGGKKPRGYNEKKEGGDGRQGYEIKRCKLLK